MRNQLFVNYAPITGLGPLKCDPVSSVQQVDGPWRPHSIPGYEIRRLAGGADEVRAIPGTLPSASVTQAASAQQKSDEPYIPPGWDSFTYHDHKGHDTTVTRLVREAEETIDEVMADIDERLASDEGLYRRLVEMRGGCACHVSPPCGACSEPITLREAEELGLFDDEEAPAKPATKPNPAIPAHAWPAPEGATHWCRSHYWRKDSWFFSQLFQRWIEADQTFEDLQNDPERFLPREVPAT